MSGDIVRLEAEGAAEVQRVAEGSSVFQTPCGDGEMPWRHWASGHAGSDVLVMLHGGSGSWTHWLRNVRPFSELLDVYAVDLPGFGDAAMLPEPYIAQDVADCIVAGVRDLLGDRRLHLMGFSWGCTPAALAAAALGDLVASIVLQGPASIGNMPRRTAMAPLIRRTPDMTVAEVWAANEENLARLMFHDRTLIDAPAVHTQVANTSRARFYSPQFALSDLVLVGLASTDCPLLTLYGEYDAPAYPDIAARERAIKAVRPDCVFEVIAAGGHWLQYECAEAFNARCHDWLKSHLAGGLSSN